ncbi:MULTISPECIES: hypothetical protein [Pontibacillus]|uniref:Uncharacterized protein n=1 Tax=Pontibacillus chungwhensis TaxID=265426 RepID=A0ABY8V362_9BACI|nr:MULTISPECIES: hypothetical protein [Pontibacillus]MCD5322156.1 hypothetical protein [Pontibacillus sp. HN14]WIF99451.1 hypothetical protein QNI29_07280 [Pontibacillus chungwhensis]
MVGHLRRHIGGAILSSVYFIGVYFFYGMALDGELGIVFSIPFAFIATLPIYLLIANPLTMLFTYLLKKATTYYLPFLTLIMTVLSFLFQYFFIAAPDRFSVAGSGYVFIILWCFLTALPSVLGVEFSDER